MDKITFLNPEFFWLFLLIPIAIAWLFWKRNIKKPITATGQETRIFTCEIWLKLTIDKPVLFMKDAKFWK